MLYCSLVVVMRSCACTVHKQTKHKHTRALLRRRCGHGIGVLIWVPCAAAAKNVDVAALGASVPVRARDFEEQLSMESPALRLNLNRAVQKLNPSDSGSEQTMV